MRRQPTRRPQPARSTPRRIAQILALLLAALVASTLAVVQSTAQDEPAVDQTTADEATVDETTADETTVEQSTVEESATESVSEDGRRVARVILGEIDADIGLAESAYLQRLLDRAEEEDAEYVVLRLNTFGGRVDAAVAMRDAILDAEAETVVFIDKRAISAGALISYACDVIVMADGGTIGAATPVTQSATEMPEAVEEKYLSYFREELRSTAEATGRDPDIAEAMVDATVEVPDVSPEGKLLTLGTKRALELGVADFKARDLDAVYAELGIEAQVLEEVRRSWSEGLVAFLTSMPVASLLGLMMLVFGYLEIQTPGVGIFGALALTCALLLYFSHSLVNLAGSEELIFFAVGVVLLVVEMFVIPGFGIAGILGLLSIGTSMVLLLIAGDWSDLSFSNPFTVDAVERVGWTFLISLALMGLMLRLLPRRKIAGITLGSPLSVEEGYASHREAEPALLGVRGVALSDLRPSGKARLGRERVDVEAVGEWIPRGAPVEVVRQVEGRVVVRRVDEDELAEPVLESSDESSDEPAGEAEA